MSHLILDIISIKNTDLLHSIVDIEELMDWTCQEYSFQILNKFKHEFSPQGITIIFALKESHFSIHTYPENDHIAIDLYTCRSESKDLLRNIASDITKRFKGRMKRITTLNRDV